jgi:hypothetical protein
MEVVMKGLIVKLVFLVLVLIGVSGCIGNPCDENYDVMDFIYDLLLEEDSYSDDSDNIVCFIEDVLDWIDSWDEEDNYDVGEPTYDYYFKVSISITDDSGAFIEDVEPSYYLTLNTKNCGSLMYSGTHSDYFSTWRHSFTEPIHFAFHDVLPVSCGGSADGTWTIIVDHPGYAIATTVHDFTLFYWKPGSDPVLTNTQMSSGEEIFLQLVTE